jgi:hypothetical protein
MNDFERLYINEDWFIDYLIFNLFHHFYDEQVILYYESQKALFF